MSFFRRKQKEPEIISQEIPLSTIFRWYLYDTELVEDVNDLAEMVGLTRISEEGETKEKEDSRERVREVTPLFSFLDFMSDVSARSLVALHMGALLDEDSNLDNELLVEKGEAMMSVYKTVALSTLMGTFSIGLNLGMIEANAVGSDVLEFGDIDE
jgi:hypothetical protein